MALRLLRGEDIQEYYKRMCSIQKAEALRHVSKEVLSKLPAIAESFDKKLLDLPANHKRMSELHLEVFKNTSNIKLLESKKGADRIDKVLQ
jgi:hypothetical protein